MGLLLSDWGRLEDVRALAERRLRLMTRAVATSLCDAGGIARSAVRWPSRNPNDARQSRRAAVHITVAGDERSILERVMDARDNGRPSPIACGIAACALPSPLGVLS